MSDNQEPYLGDLEKTAVLGELFEIPREQRDDRWTSKFLANVAEASFACGNPQVINGPDGFLYFQLNMPEPYKEFQCFVVKHLVPDFLVQNGIGIVINAAKGNPDWVFTYGDIVNYYLKNEFYSGSNKSVQVEQEVLPHDESVLVAQPSETYLPTPTRNAIKKFLASLGVNDCKILLMARTKSETVQQELVFNLTPDKFERQEQWEHAMTGIAWYLPRQYTFVSMKESSLSGFESL